MPANVSAIHIVKRPLVTEKNTDAMNDAKRFAFLVDARATKDEIKAAVQELYKVRVVGVNTQVRKGESRRNKFGLGHEPTTKKATVRLHQDDTIELF